MSPSTAVAIRYLARTIAALRAGLVRWWYQRERTWWRRRQSSQWPALPGGGGRASRRPVSGTVNGIIPNLASLPTQPQVLPLDAGGAGAALDLPGLIDRAGRQAAAAASLGGGLIQPGHGEPANHPHRRERVPDRAAEQPLGSVWGDLLSARRSSTRCAWGSGSSPRRRTCPPAAAARSARSTAVAVPAAQPVSGGPMRRLSRRQQPPSVL